MRPAQNNGVYTFPAPPPAGGNTAQPPGQVVHTYLAPPHGVAPAQPPAAPVGMPLVTEPETALLTAGAGGALPLRRASVPLAHTHNLYAAPQASAQVIGSTAAAAAAATAGGYAPAWHVSAATPAPAPTPVAPWDTPAPSTDMSPPHAATPFTLPTHVAHAAHATPLGQTLEQYTGQESFAQPGDAPAAQAYWNPTVAGAAPPAPPSSSTTHLSLPPAPHTAPLATPPAAFVFGGVEPVLVPPASVACHACRRRGARCSGTRPCSGCATRGTRCIYAAGGAGGTPRRGSLGPPPPTTAAVSPAPRRASDAGITIHDESSTPRKRRFATDGAPDEYLSPLRGHPYPPSGVRPVRSAGQLAVPPTPARRSSVPTLAGAPAWTPPMSSAPAPNEGGAAAGVAASFTFPANPARPTHTLSPFPSVLGAATAAGLLAPPAVRGVPPRPGPPERTLSLLLPDAPTLGVSSSTGGGITPPPPLPARSASWPYLPDLPNDQLWAAHPAGDASIADDVVGGVTGSLQTRPQ